MQYGQFAVDYEQRPYDPARMREERWDKLQEAMKKHGLGALLLYDFDNQRYAGYYTLHQYARRRLGIYCLVVAGERVPFIGKDKYKDAWETLRMPWFNGRDVLENSSTYQLCGGLPEHPDFFKGSLKATVKSVKAVLEQYGMADMPVGIDVTSQAMSEVMAEGGVKLTDGWNAIVEAISIKTSDELHCLRMAGVISDSAHWEAARAMRPGMTELEIAGIAANACYKHGAEELEGPSFVVCSGERSGHALPNMPTDRRVRPGDFVVLDVNGVSFQGYRTCHYRTYVVGDKPTDYQKEVYGVAYDAMCAMQSVMKSGVTTVDANEEWMKLGNFPGGWGYVTKFPEPGRYYFGSGAHPIGMRSGDPGYTLAGWGKLFGDFPASVLKDNQTFASEVGVFSWDGKRWAKDGVKQENCGAITPDGLDLFYRAPMKEIIVCGLPGEYHEPTPSAYSAKK